MRLGYCRQPQARPWLRPGLGFEVVGKLVGVTDDRQHKFMRREILLGYIAVLEQPGKLIDACAAVSGDANDLRLAVEQAFNLGPVAADAVISMQIRRFTPRERNRIMDELAELDAQLRYSAPPAKQDER